MGRFGRRVRRRRHHVGAGEFVAFEVGLAADHGHVEEVKQFTHDTIINHWGSRRRSGVRWRIWGPDKAHEILEQMISDGMFAKKPETIPQMREFAERWSDTVHLVAADADIIPPIHPGHRTR